MNNLFTKFKLRGVEVKNRIVIPPMCTYSATNGLANDWHQVHLGSRAVGGAGMIIVEATAVNPTGRITQFDLGLWCDEQIEPLKNITNFMLKYGSIPCIQLAHAGRKACSNTPWDGSVSPTDGWDIVAPSALAFSPDHNIPIILSEKDIIQIVNDFKDAAIRAIKAGFKVIEIHAAHGYLLHQFLSLKSNERTDNYGGSLENRARFLFEVVKAIRSSISNEFPLLVRLSVTDWIDGGLTLDDSIEISYILKKLGVDLIDVSSGGIVPDLNIPVAIGYQTAFAKEIKDKVNISTSAVGLITDAIQAEHILSSGQADLVMLGRELLRDPYWPMHAAEKLQVNTSWPIQYLRAAPPGSTARKSNIFSI